MHVEKLQGTKAVFLPEYLYEENGVLIIIAQKFKARFLKIIGPGQLEEIDVNEDLLAKIGGGEELNDYEIPGLFSEENHFEGKRPRVILLVDATFAGMGQYVTPLRHLLREVRANGGHSIAYACGDAGHPIVKAWTDADLRYVIEGTYIPKRRRNLATGLFQSVDAAQTRFNEPAGWIHPDSPTPIEEFWDIATKKLDRRSNRPVSVASTTGPSSEKKKTERGLDDGVRKAIETSHSGRGTNNSAARKPQTNSFRRWVLAGLIAFGLPAAVYKCTSGFGIGGANELEDKVTENLPSPEIAPAGIVDEVNEAHTELPPTVEKPKKATNSRRAACDQTVSELLEAAGNPEVAMRKYGTLTPKHCK